MDKTGDWDMQRALEQELGQEVYLIHRLDRPVGGVVVFAKTAEAAAALNRQVQQRGMKKVYLAVVEGETASEETLKDILWKDSRTNQSKVVAEGTKNAKKAELSYKTLQQLHRQQETLSLVQVTLKTGRHHQIRVQFSSRNWPLYGDRKYGAKRRYGVTGFGLFAHQLSFVHPKSGQWMTFTAVPQGDPFSFFMREGGMEDGETEKMS